jgi:hypothetical protein
MAMLPGLRFAKVAYGKLTPEAQAALPADLEELWASPLDLAMLSKVPRLRLLRTRLPTGNASQCKALAALAALRVLRLECLKPLRGVETLAKLAQLEELWVDKLEGLDMRAFSACRGLRTVVVGSSSNVRNLDSIPSLETLSLEGQTCPPLAPLAKVPRLAHLSIGTNQTPQDLAIVGELRGLRSLSISCGSVGSPMHIQGTRMFSKLENLESLRCLGLLDDHDLKPLASLKRLRYVSFYGTFAEKAVSWLQNRLPGCKLDLTIGQPAPRVPEETFGLLTAFRGDDGSWQVFQDLAFALKFEDNFEVQDAVKAHLRKRAPELLSRLTFDSDAEAFSVRASTREDVSMLDSSIAKLDRTEGKPNRRS